MRIHERRPTRWQVRIYPSMALRTGSRASKRGQAYLIGLVVAEDATDGPGTGGAGSAAQIGPPPTRLPQHSRMGQHSRVGQRLAVASAR